MSSKKVLMIIPHMIGGGAERVAAQLINRINSLGYSTKFILTSSKKDQVVRSDLNENTELILLTEELEKETVFERLRYFPKRVISSIIGNILDAFGANAPAIIGKWTLEWQYHREIKYVRNLLAADPDLSAIAFLQPAIPILVLASEGLDNKIVLSERSDPNRLMTKRYGKKFISKHYQRANTVVFQTEDAKKVYPKNVSEKGIVISNPLKENLPSDYHGARNKNITTFCRISKSKNLPLLIDAFAKLHKEHSDYNLRIIGDVSNQEDEAVFESINNQIKNLSLGKSVKLEPFMKNVHEAIMNDAMYVSSSDFEGISNAMLEAMAIGMPVVCTDCPIGGARATITDGENGLLVPIKDSKSLYLAMKRIIEEPELANKLSENASKLRDELSLDTITNKWISLLG